MNITAFISGLLFAVGLAVGGMTMPDKVVGFLDFFGSWDPSLAFVMGGAVMTYAVGLRLILRRKAPLFADMFRVPTRRDLTPSLIGGAALFGIGWGMGGFCPGPGLVSLVSAAPAAATFVVAMVIGMGLYRVYEAARTRMAQEAAAQ